MNVAIVPTRIGGSIYCPDGRRYYEISVIPGGRESQPVLPLLHAGDWFEDESGRQYEITRTMITQHPVWENGPHGQGIKSYAYWWEYVAVAKAD